MAETSLRDPQAPTITIDMLLAKAGEYLPADRLKLIQDAYGFAEQAHDGQLRNSGDPYIQHPLHAAMIVASLQLDAVSLAGALLHDVQEDCGVSSEEIARRFGREVIVASSVHRLDGPVRRRS